jgi:hypothetical protein
MGKFDSLKTLKKTKAQVDHRCSKCGAEIGRGEDYYKEHLEDKFLHSLHAKKFCAQCFLKHGDALLKKQS